MTYQKVVKVTKSIKFAECL